MAWIESHQELRDHPKRKRLSRLLEINRRETVGLLHELWWWAYDYAPEGDLSAFSDEDIADAIDWEGDSSQLAEALVQAGFIDDSRRIHDWEDFAQKWIERRQADRERKRAQRQPVNGVQKTSAGHPPEHSPPSGVTGPDLTKPDLTGPDLNPSPNPSPQAGKGLAKTNEQRRRRDPNAVVSVPLTSADEQTWREALGYMEGGGAMPSLVKGVLSHLEPVARSAEGGGLLLRAPPKLRGDAVTFAHVVRNALEKVGDAAASRAAIVD